MGWKKYRDLKKMFIDHINDEILAKPENSSHIYILLGSSHYTLLS